MTMFDPNAVFGRCARCGGSLTNPHICSWTLGESPEVAVQSKICHVIRVYAAAMNLENKELALAWGCSESTVSRFLNGKNWPDGPTMCRIFAWLTS